MSVKVTVSFFLKKKPHYLKNLKELFTKKKKIFKFRKLIYLFFCFIRKCCSLPKKNKNKNN